MRSVLYLYRRKAAVGRAYIQKGSKIIKCTVCGEIIKVEANKGSGTVLTVVIILAIVAVIAAGVAVFVILSNNNGQGSGKGKGGRASIGSQR